MNSYVFVVSIVAIGCATGIITTYFKTRANRQQQQPGTDFDEIIAQINALEERMQVIERIVTENRFDLRSEIEKL